MILGVSGWVMLCILELVSSADQGCPSKQQVLSAIRQMQKLLSSQEAQYTQGMRMMKRKLSLLQNTVSKQASKHNETCPKLNAPNNGKKFGSRYLVGHEVHFACDPGFVLVGSNSRVCLKDKSWSGQLPFCKKWTTSQSDPSFSRQPRCTDVQGSQHCSCESGFHLSGDDVRQCRDVDECELFQTGRLARLCVHSCVNTPGSYQCACPSGYNLLEDTRACEDINECTSNQHNCTREKICINIHGGFHCVRPECPKSRLNASYVKTSQFKCERNPCPMENKVCANAAYSITFHYLTLTSNLRTPRALFRMTSSRFTGDTMRFSIVGGIGQNHFSIQRSDRQTGELVLAHPIQGPATLEVEMEMTELSGKTVLTKHISKVTIFVSRYNF
ncbi:fibulin-7-like isoform X2 [Scyliorhinus canicula]|uniref:fibulin-7-like isoform X2 n=1 Tax=Scyliorhinus canicula TaxID=7830 RepID=UPI0018F35315|nr:fibulin-7-like isoform X2 [Scyliorhinus canicula]